MEGQDIRKQVSVFINARKNLLIVVIFTWVNLLLSAFEADLYMLFSATVPQFLFEVGRVAAEEVQSNAYLIAGLVIAFICILVYFACWLFAKRWRALMLVALILFGLDTLIFVLLSFSVGFEASSLLDIAFHVWILYYLICGVSAWAKLRGADDEEVRVALEAISSAKPGALAQNGLPGQTAADTVWTAQNEGERPEMNRTSPLRMDDKKGRVLIAADYEGLHICMKRTRGLTELIVNGYVYDEIKGMFEHKYSLSANVQNVTITGIYEPAHSHMYLFANDERIAKKMRLR